MALSTNFIGKSWADMDEEEEQKEIKVQEPLPPMKSVWETKVNWKTVYVSEKDEKDEKDEFESHSEIDWDKLKQIKKTKKSWTINDICGNFFYGMDSEPAVCKNEDCHRIHTHDIAKLQFLTGRDKIKKYQCPQGYYCGYYMCNYQHAPDMYILTENGKPLMKCSKLQQVNAIREWRSYRSQIRKKYNNNNKYKK